MGIKFANNASTNITHALTADATSISVTPGTGDLFPSIVEGKDYFYATLAGNNGLEIVKVTRRVLDTMTVERAQDGTSALIFNQGDLFELRIVAADFNDTFSEVDDKLEASIEDTIEIVNSALARTAPTSHASSSTEYGAGSSEQYGHLKSHDEPDSTFTAAAGHAFSPAGAAAMQDVLEGQIGDLASVVSGNAATQAAKDAEQDAAINSKVATVNGLTPDSNGNVDVGGMPLGTLFPYTGKDVPAGTLRADGTTYTNMQASFPEFYEWVVNSGLTVALGDYALVEGSCGYYGLDTGTGIVRMPTLAAGVFGTVTAGQYGQAVQAGLPNITGELINFATSYASTGDINNGGALRWKGTNNKTNIDTGDKRDIKTLNFDASNSNSIYGNSDTVTPSHVKYPWVIVVYNAAVPPSVAQAGEFIEMMDKLATALPTGTVVPHAGNKDLNGYLLCNGAAVSRTTYAKLFEAIGTTYGAGDGSTTFNLPNLTDRFIQGSGTAGTVKEAGLPEIEGNAWNPSSSTGAGGGYYPMKNGAFVNITVEIGELRYAAPGGINTDRSSTLRFLASASNGLYGKSGTVQPPALTMRYYIKY